MGLKPRRLAAWLALGTLALTASAASASRTIGFSPAGPYEGTTTFLYIAGGGWTITCAATLSGAVNASVAKVAGAAIANVTELTINPCRLGTLPGGIIVTALTGSWNLTYEGFEGVLPNDISRVRTALRNVKILLKFNDSFFGGCLYQGDLDGRLEVAGMVARTLFAEGVMVKVEALLNSTFCPREGFVAGTFDLSPVFTLRLGA